MLPTAEHLILVDGYIRINNQDLNIPYDIYKVCYDFYNDIIIWNFYVPTRSGKNRHHFGVPPVKSANLSNANAVSAKFEVMGIPK